MKYIDVFGAKGGIDTEGMLNEVAEKFLPDILEAMGKRGKSFDAPEVMLFLQSLTGLLFEAAVVYCNKYKKPPVKIRLLLEISADNKACIFFSPYSSNDTPDEPLAAYPIAIIGSDPEDYQKLREKFPDKKISYLPGISSN